MKSKANGSHRFSLKGRVALVTGAAGQLGRHFTQTLASADARVAMTDVSIEALRKAQRALPRRFASRTRLFEMDVRDPVSVEAAVQAISLSLGPVDILVNNAGVGIFTPFEARTPQEVDLAVDVNLKGVLWCCQIVARQMQRRKRGCIVNIGSLYGVVAADSRIYGASGRNSSEIYAATKAGVIHLTRYLAVYLAPHGIRVNAISPGGVFNRQDPGFVERYRRNTPLRRMARPDDLEGALVFLASDAASYVTGQNLMIDGGFNLW